MQDAKAECRGWVLALSRPCHTGPGRYATWTGMVFLVWVISLFSSR